MENQTELTQKIEDLQDLDMEKIKDETWSYIFSHLQNDEERFKEFLDRFDDIYYLSVLPTQIEKYINYPVIYSILKRYEHTAEWRKLEIMLFKLKEVSKEQNQEALEKLKTMYPWLDIRLDDSKYQYVVGYFWWSAGRSNSYYMEEIKKIYPVKTLV